MNSACFSIFFSCFCLVVWIAVELPLESSLGVISRLRSSSVRVHVVEQFAPARPVPVCCSWKVKSILYLYPIFNFKFVRARGTLFIHCYSVFFIIYFYCVLMHNIYMYITSKTSLPLVFFFALLLFCFVGCLLCSYLRLFRLDHSSLAFVTLFFSYLPTSRFEHERILPI